MEPVHACDLSAVAELSAAISEVPSERRLAMVGRGWGALCTGDAVLDTQTSQLQAVAPEQVQLVDLQTALMDAWDWNQVCPGGPLALSMATKLDPAAGRAHLWKACELQRTVAFTEAEWTSAKGPIVIPLLAWRVLTEGGADNAAARPVVRALAGL
ncbi:MAG: hypothetical protein H6738_00995 [Alphaproteobacteria bacterium]|nr:hypothetical protein [Alphaproteobacteria bacterium]MCB9695345.1 hypothetical protein [Alphaproteobacteria bacterium]